eukprot:m.1207738 g.1207738  ORF g.1207738 m.1207738 type:complete len:330 (-) comp24587_c1_seq1:104-1093(-)
MGPLSISILAKCKCHQRRGREESKEAYVRRLTHFGLYKREITELTDALHNCQNAAAFFLYENMIPEINYFDKCKFLTQLYLQHNRIGKLENLKSLKMLEKLYIGSNELTVIEGLENLQSLRELHADNQRLPAGEKLVFDPRSLMALSQSLQVLNVSGNRLDDLKDLTRLGRLRSLNISNNFIQSLRELGMVLRSNDSLLQLRIAGNPICHVRKIREKIIPLSSSLQMLDAQPITPVQRQFLENLVVVQSRRTQPSPRHHHGLQREQPPRSLAGRGPGGSHRRRHGSLGSGMSAYTPRQAKFPSKFSSANPHWLPPLPAIKAKPKSVSHL